MTHSYVRDIVGRVQMLAEIAAYAERALLRLY